MNNKVKSIVGALLASVVLVVGAVMVVHSRVSELAGLAVAQDSTLWNSVIDAAKGDEQSRGILGQSTYLFDGLSFNRMRSVTDDGIGNTGLLGVGIYLYDGSFFNRLRGGVSFDGSSPEGFLPNQLLAYDGISSYQRVRSGLTGDNQSEVGLLSTQNFVWNNLTLGWDRKRVASSDTLGITGIQGVGSLAWNGTAFDRIRSASSTNNTATTSLGGLQVTQLSTWSVTDTKTGAVQATATKTAGGGASRHVATGITICRGDTAVAAPALVHLRDGATGAGTILRSWVIGIDTANGSKCENVTGLNMTGSANTAMTLEFAAAGSATSISTVTLTGYSTP